jgi:4-amino-4-deoxy-L-arabinose transferase-like glycosyltransferase
MAGLARTFALVAALLFAVPLMISVPLLDPDEGLHAAIAQEMVLQRDYVTPAFLGEPFLDKPVLFFWIEAFSLRAFGMNEAAVRLPPLVFGALGMLSVALLGMALFGRTVGLVAGIVYGTMLLPVAISNVAVHDIALVPFMCGAAWCVWRASDSPRAWAWGVPAGVWLGLSVLTKGLAGAVFVAIFAVAVAAVRKPAVSRLAIALTTATGIALVLAAPWYIAMERANPGYLHYYFIERHLRGYLTATQRHGGRPWWYYLPIVIGGALPWTGYLVSALRHLRKDEKRPVTWIVWLWFALGLVFLSAGESKLVTYVLPIFPALALVVAEEIVSFGRSRAGRMTLIVSRAALPLVTVILLRVALHATIELAWIIPVVATAIVLLLARNAPRVSSLDAGISGDAMIALIPLVAVLAAPLPRAAAYLTSRDLAQFLNAAPRLPSRVSVFDERIGSLVFYLSPALRAQATPERIQSTSSTLVIERARTEPSDALTAVRDDQLQQFVQLFPQPPQSVGRAGTFTLYRADHVRDALEPSRQSRASLSRR